MNRLHLHVRTKTVATVGPACRDVNTLAALLNAGVDVFRINMAHGSRKDHEQFVSDIRRVADEAGRPVGILIDLAGPKIRLGQLQQDPTLCREGSEFRIVPGESASAADELPCSFQGLVEELAVGDSVMLADGTVSMQVIRKEAEAAVCRVTSEGEVRSRQGINLPGVALTAAVLSDEDRDNAVWAARNQIDFVGLSFVRSADDVRELKYLLAQQRSSAMVIAKIEKREALDQLDDIVLESDGVMVARGDLGVEIDVAETPLVQKRIIATCQKLLKPVIVATQMLESMQHSRRPTRAETTDVANAILDGADACMLSGETAVGDYPEEAVRMMNRIMIATERTLLGQHPKAPPVAAVAGVHPITSAVVYGAATIAAQLSAQLVVVATCSGATARVKAKQRDFVPTVGVSDSTATLRRMCLFWGIIPLAGAPAESPLAVRKFVADWGKERQILRPGDRVVFVTGTGIVQQAHNLIVVHEIE